jgi:hypothetical protein
MIYGKAFCATTLMASLLVSGAALAQQSNSSTSGPAAGTRVEPSTAIQKEYEHRSGSGTKLEEVPSGAPAAAGVPGAEGSPGTQSGPAAK